MGRLSKRKDDVKFINPDTMEVECTFNECANKFTNAGNETGGYKCTECGRIAQAEKK